MDFDALLLEESRRTLDIAGCQSAEALLKSVLNQKEGELDDENPDMLYAAGFETAPRELSEEELDQVNAAGKALADETCACSNSADLPQYERRV